MRNLNFVVAISLLFSSFSSFAAVKATKVDKISAPAETKPAASGKKEPRKKKEMVLSAGIDFEPKKMSLKVKVNKNKTGEQTMVEEFTVYNKTDESILVRPVIYEFNPDDYGVNQYQKSVANLKNPELSLTEYVIYPKETFSLNPRESKKVPIQLKLNTSLIGTKYAMITFERVQNLVSKNQNQNVRASSFSFELKILGAIIVDVVGSGKVAVVQELKPMDKSKMIIDLANTGNHILEVPELEAVLFDSNMKMVEKFRMTMLGKGSIIQTKKKRFVHTFVKKYPKGKYKLFTHFKANSGVFFDTAKFDLEL
jgi:hypothetical protein